MDKPLYCRVVSSFISNKLFRSSKAVISHITKVDALTPDAIWVASTHPDNKAAQMLNKRAGFGWSISQMHRLSRIILSSTPDFISSARVLLILCSFQLALQAYELEF